MRRYSIIEYRKVTYMCILGGLKYFVRNGVQVFSTAARGSYSHVSPRIEMLKDEISSSPSGPALDKIRLRQDRAKIYGDVSAAFDEYKSSIKK